MIASASCIAFAESNEPVKYQITDGKEIRPMMPKIIERKIEKRLDDRGVKMTTGSSTVDAQIKALIQERDQKIKAINEEYFTFKIKKIEAWI